MNMKQVLDNLVEVDGITSAVLVGRDGFVIEYSGEKTLDSEAVGAMVTIAFKACDNMGRELNLGGAFQVMFEFERNMVMAVAIGEEAVLAVVTAANANLGIIRFQVKKFSRELASPA